MKKIKSRSIVVVSTALIIIFIIVVGYKAVINISGGEDLGVYEVVELRVIEGDVVKEVRIRYPEKHKYYYENGVEIEKVTLLPTEGKEIIKDIDIYALEGRDTLAGKRCINELTWEMSLEAGVEYVKYLIDSGGSVNMMAFTPQFIEVFLIQEEAIKRVIVFKDSIMVGDLDEGVEIPSSEGYFKKYRGYLDGGEST